MLTMPRLIIARSESAKTRTLSAYDDEWGALQSIADQQRFKTPWDVVRWLARGCVDPALKKSRKLFREPNVKNGAVK